MDCSETYLDAESGNNLEVIKWIKENGLILL